MNRIHMKDLLLCLAQSERTVRITTVLETRVLLLDSPYLATTLPPNGYDGRCLKESEHPTTALALQWETPSAGGRHLAQKVPSSPR